MLEVATGKEKVMPAVSRSFMHLAQVSPRFLTSEVVALLPAI